MPRGVYKRKTRKTRVKGKPGTIFFSIALQEFLTEAELNDAIDTEALRRGLLLEVVHIHKVHPTLKLCSFKEVMEEQD